MNERARLPSLARQQSQSFLEKPSGLEGEARSVFLLQECEIRTLKNKRLKDSLHLKQ